MATKSKWSWTPPSRRNPSAETKSSLEATVNFWCIYLTHKLTRYDMAEEKHERKRRVPVNIYRLGHLLAAVREVEKSIPARQRRSSSEAAIEAFRVAMHKHLSPTFTPIKAVDKAIDKYLETGKRPKIGGGAVATKGKKNPTKAKSRVRRRPSTTLQDKILTDVKLGGGRWMTLKGTYESVGGTKAAFDRAVTALVKEGKLVKRGFLIQPVGGVPTAAKARSKARSKVRKARSAKARKSIMPIVVSYDKLTKVFNQLRDAAAIKHGRLARVALKVDPQIHDSARHFAMTTPVSAGIVITVAPELAKEPRNVMLGVLRHEFGHAAVMMGLVPPSKGHSYDAIERHADRTAEKLFGAKIYYDKRDVEVSGPGAKGKRPRPAGLR